MNNKPPLISVVMPVFNGEKYIQSAIDSILIQTFSNFEFIIIDDASVDNTANLIHLYTDSRVILLQNERNIGNYPSRNRGMNIARGRYICVMDADDIAFSERLETQFNYLETHPELLAVGSDFVFFPDYHRAGVFKNFETLLIAFLNNNRVLHPSLMIRTETMITLGGYNEKYVYSSDYDLLCRILLKGKVENIPDVLMMYRWHKSQISQLHKIEQAKFADAVRRQYHKAFINCYKTSKQSLVSLSDVSFPEIGQAICYYTYARYTKDTTYQKMADDILDYVYKNITKDLPVCLERGLCGLGCGLIYLLRNNFVCGNEDEILSDIDSALLYNITGEKAERFIDWRGCFYYLFLRVFETLEEGIQINSNRLSPFLFYVLNNLNLKLTDEQDIDENLIIELNEFINLKKLLIE